MLLCVGRTKCYIVFMSRFFLLFFTLLGSLDTCAQIMCDALEYLPLHLIDSTVKRIEIEYHSKAYTHKKVTMYVDSAGLSMVRIDDRCFKRMDEGIAAGWLIDTAGLPGKADGLSTIGFKVEFVYFKIGHTTRVQYLNNFYFSAPRTIYLTVAANAERSLELPKQNLVYASDNGEGFEVCSSDGRTCHHEEGSYLDYLFTGALASWQERRFDRNGSFKLSESPYLGTRMHFYFWQTRNTVPPRDSVFSEHFRQLHLYSPLPYTEEFEDLRMLSLSLIKNYRTASSIYQGAFSIAGSWLGFARRSKITPLYIDTLNSYMFRINDFYDPDTDNGERYNATVGYLNLSSFNGKRSSFISLDATAFGLVRLPARHFYLANKRSVGMGSDNMVYPEFPAKWKKVIATEVLFEGDGYPFIRQIKVSSLWGFGQSSIVTVNIIR